jgi:hypothetical protein
VEVVESDLAVDNILVGVSLVRAPMGLVRDDVITNYHLERSYNKFITRNATLRSSLFYLTM